MSAMNLPRRLLALLFLASAACGSSSSSPPAPPPPAAVGSVVAVADAAPAPVAATVAEAADAGEPSPSTSAVRPSSSCKLKASLRDVGPTPSGKRFKLLLKNEGTSAVRLVMPGDGSESGWRTPILTWSATQGTKPIAVRFGRHDAMMNRIEASEIFSLAPGASRELGEWVLAPSLPAGAYELRLTYRNDPGLTSGKTAANASDEVKHLIADTTPCEATTNSVLAKLP